MYNFNLLEDEELQKVFDKVFIKQDDNEKITTIALTNKRLLFLDYLTQSEASEVLRIAKGIEYLKHKEVYYEINLKDIETIKEDNMYKLFYKNNKSFEFDNEELYKTLKCKLN